jgi:chemotaxis protein MotA
MAADASKKRAASTLSGAGKHSQASKLDGLSLVGITLALLALIGGSVLKGSGIASLWSSAAFVIVIVGTFAAILMQTPLSTFRRAIAIAPWVFRTPPADGAAVIASIVSWSHLARRQGLLALEPFIEKQNDPTLKRGLQMLVDGVEPDAIRHMLEIEVLTEERADYAAAKVFEGLGTYAPTLGIIGAVMGLMAVMKNLADPSKLGSGIAAAFTATIYGIGVANLVFLPMANKLKSVIETRTNQREMGIEGLVALAQGENPRNIEAKLAGYLTR